MIRPMETNELPHFWCRYAPFLSGDPLMHAAVLLLALIPGADARVTDVSTGETGVPTPAIEAIAAAPTHQYMSGSGAQSMRPVRHLTGVFGPMPQSCYQPTYGCYNGQSRYMNRYPAFHGTYYRRPYNYRNYFDYPWHAGLHEPTSHFSSSVPAEQIVPQQDLAPAPPMGVETRGPSRSIMVAPSTARANP
jgi:hypothetical protein